MADCVSKKYTVANFAKNIRPELRFGRNFSLHLLFQWGARITDAAV